MDLICHYLLTDVRSVRKSVGNVFGFPEGLILWDGKAFFLQELFFWVMFSVASYSWKVLKKLLNLDTANPVIFYYLLIIQLFTEQVLSTLLLVSSSSSIWLLGMIRTDFPWSRVISSEFLKITLSLELLGKSALIVDREK